MLTKSKRAMIEICKQIESEDAEEETIDFDEYLEALKVLASRNKSVYDDLKRWGPDFKIFVYMLMKKIYDTEILPREFSRTRLQALHKKGSFSS